MFNSGNTGSGHVGAVPVATVTGVGSGGVIGHVTNFVWDSGFWTVHVSSLSYGKERTDRGHVRALTAGLSSGVVRVVVSHAANHRVGR